jgi:shikimate dehydrogenase
MELSGKTRLVGLIGWPVSHSLSPAMHSAAINALGLDWAYVPMPVHPDELETAVRGLPALGFRGVNVTVPHKEGVIPYLDELDADAEAIGAVNTLAIERRDERAWLIGYNTDASGLLADLMNLKLDIAGRDCLILGAGGSARAVAYGLAITGGRVQVLSRREKQAHELVQDLLPYLTTARLHYRPTGTRLSARPLSALREALNESPAPLIVNATPVGMSPHVGRSVWPDRMRFPEGAFVYDLVYNPTHTKLLRQAETSGCHTANGLGMLVQQGALAFQLWTGAEPDVSVMADAAAL